MTFILPIKFFGWMTLINMFISDITEKEMIGLGSTSVKGKIEKFIIYAFFKRVSICQVLERSPKCFETIQNALGRPCLRFALKQSEHMWATQVIPSLAPQLLFVPDTFFQGQCNILLIPTLIHPEETDTKKP